VEANARLVVNFGGADYKGGKSRKLDEREKTGEAGSQVKLRAVFCPGSRREGEGGCRAEGEIQRKLQKREKGGENVPRMRKTFTVLRKR